MSIEKLRELALSVRNWGRWGPNDEIGTLNYITPESIAGACRLATTGKVFSLGMPLQRKGPQSGTRQRFNPIHTMFRDGGDAPRNEAAAAGHGRCGHADQSVRAQVTVKTGFRIAMAAIAGVFPLALSAAFAQDFPTRVIRIILPFPPGGGTDVFARVLAVRLQEALGQSTVVDNRPGAGGNIGTELTVKSPPDGYTLMFTTTAVAVNVTLYPKLSFDARKDLIAITQLGSTSSVLSLHPSVPARSVKELVALSKRTRGGLNFGSNGSGTSSHLAGIMFAHVAGAALTHIPYKGAAPAINALIGGEVEVAFPGVNSVLPMLRAGKVRVLAVSTRHRSSVLPDLPTLDSIYPGIDVDQWFVLFAPAGTPRSIVTRLHAEAIRGLQHPEVKAFMAREGIDPVGSTPEEAAAFFNRAVDKFAMVVKIAGVKAE